MFGRERLPEEVSGVFKDICLARAADPELHEVGQDGGLVSAMLVYALEHDMIDAALVSYLEGDGTSWKAVPGIARNRADVIASAGSRYTYSANTLAYQDLEKEDERIALVGMSCQSSVPPVMKQRKAGKVARRLSLNIGLLCSKTFDDAIFEELFEAKYGLKKADIKKMNIKGVFQIWMHDGAYHEMPLKECHQWTREGCKMCPDFAAEHADISTGGIGKYNDWTLTIVRTDAGRELMERMLADGVIEIRPGDDDPDAIALMHKLSTRSRKRWPEFAIPGPRRIAPVDKPAAGRESRTGMGERDESPAPTCGSCSSKTTRWSPAASRPRWRRKTASRSSASRARSTTASCASGNSVPTSSSWTTASPTAKAPKRPAASA